MYVTPSLQRFSSIALFALSKHPLVNDLHYQLEYFSISRSHIILITADLLTSLFVSDLPHFRDYLSVHHHLTMSHQLSPVRRHSTISADRVLIYDRVRPIRSSFIKVLNAESAASFNSDNNLNRPSRSPEPKSGANASEVGGSPPRSEISFGSPQSRGSFTHMEEHAAGHASTYFIVAGTFSALAV